jgi:hypothetical protein
VKLRGGEKNPLKSVEPVGRIAEGRLRVIPVEQSKYAKRPQVQNA